MKQEILSALKENCIEHAGFENHDPGVTKRVCPRTYWGHPIASVLNPLGDLWFRTNLNFVCVWRDGQANMVTPMIDTNCTRSLLNLLSGKEFFIESPAVRSIHMYQLIDDKEAGKIFCRFNWHNCDDMPLEIFQEINRGLIERLVKASKPYRDRLKMRLANKP